MRTRTVNQALARVNGSTKKVDEMVALADAHITAVKNSPAYAGEVKVAVDAWEVETKTLAQTHKDVGDLAKQLAVARTAEASARRRWLARKQGALTAVTTYGDGSKDLVMAAGFGVGGRGPHQTATEVLGLEGRRSKLAKTALARWKTTKGNKGYEAQYAAEPANVATYSAPILCSKGKLELGEQTAGATIYVRVRALDATLPTGRTEYTAWVAVTVSG